MPCSVGAVRGLPRLEALAFGLLTDRTGLLLRTKRVKRGRQVRRPERVGHDAVGDARGTEGSRTLRWREVDSNHRFLVGRSNRDGRRAWLFRKGSGSVGEPKV